MKNNKFHENTWKNNKKKKKFNFWKLVENNE